MRTLTSVSFLAELHSYKVSKFCSQIKSIQPKVWRSRVFRAHSTDIPQIVPLAVVVTSRRTPSVPRAPSAHAGAQTSVLGAGGSSLQTENRAGHRRCQNGTPSHHQVRPCPLPPACCTDILWAADREVVTGHARDRDTQNWTHMITRTLPSRLYSWGGEEKPFERFRRI